MLQHRTKYKLPELFMVSSGRSGTTLLASILNASEQIYIPYESDFIARAYPYYSDLQQFTEDDYRHIFKIFQSSAKQNGWGMSEEYVIRELKERSPQTFAEVNAVIYQAFHKQEQTENLAWGIKAPVLIASLKRITKVCPQSKIVHLIRDGRDVYLSYKKIHETSKVKFGPKSVLQNALYWVDGLRRIEEFKSLSPHSQLYELRYEDLINNPDNSLRQLCQFLSIEYQPSMHENFNSLERNNKVVPDSFKATIHKKVHGGLDATNTHKYLSAMSRWERIKFEFVAAPYLTKYDYKTEYSLLNTFLFAPLRFLLYFLARQFNDRRYSKRDRNTYHKAISQG